MTPHVIAAIQVGDYVAGMSDVLTHGNFGDVLREWRGRRSRSQLDLAADAGVSQRHISFLETGRSKPSREMVIHLGVVLDVGLRDRNSGLLAAGFAPVYAERSINDPDLGEIRRALELMLGAHEPFPAYVIDRQWNLVMANDAAGRLIGSLPVAAQMQASNLMRLVFHPDGLRSRTNNWEVAAAALLRRLEREVAENPADADLAGLLEEALGFQGVPGPARIADVPSAHDVLVPLDVTVDGEDVSLFTTIATLASPSDITLEELRLETLLPADAHTEQVLRRLADAEKPS